MRNISVWGHNHVWPARLLLVLCVILLNGLGFIVGKVLLDAEVQLPAYLLYVLAVPFLWAWCTYPVSSRQNNYKSRKLRDGVLITITLLQVVCLANLRTPFVASVQPAWASVESLSPKPAVEIKVPETKKPHSLKKKMWQQLRKNIRFIRQHYRQASNGEKAALIILSILVAFILFYLVLALSCGIACSGSEGLALFVALLGTGLIVFLLVWVIKSINRKDRVKPKPETSSI